MHAICDRESDRIVDNPFVNKPEVRDEQGVVKPTANIVAEEPNVNGSSKPKDRQSMKRVLLTLHHTTGFLTNEILMKNSNFMGSPYDNVMKWTHDIFIAM